MKRDMDLVRRILLEVEKSDAQGSDELIIEGYSDQEISYHVMILAEANLLVGTDVSSSADCSWFADRLTWWGHEFLDAARDEGLWKQARKSGLERLASLSFEVLQRLLTEMALQALGLK